MGTSEYFMLFVASFFKGITLDKSRRLDYKSLSGPETHSFKWLDYKCNKFQGI